jgi:hypothetical protein
MGSRVSGIHALAARCRKVGWKVTQPPSAGGGYRVVCGDGHVAILHASYSDRNGIRAVTKELDTHGLGLAEEKMRIEREADKVKRLDAERKAADAKGAKLAREAALTKLAAGPYASAEHVPLDWFLAEHPAPWMRLVIITPDVAAALLERNSDNRPLRRRTVEHYCRIIQAGRWHLTHQGMAMDQRGILQDGQHRLHACVETGQDVSVPFFVGMPTENFKAIDEGRNRTAADTFAKAGEIDVSLLSSVVRLATASREPYPKAFLKMKTTNEQLHDSFKGDPERLRTAVHWGRARYQSAKVSVTALATARYLITDASGDDNAYVEAFFNGLITGTKGSTRVLLDADDPRLQVRNQLQMRRERKQRTSAVEQVSMIIWAWNNVVSGRRARHVKWTELQNDVPAISICRDRGRNASGTPELLRNELPARAADE